MENTYTEDTYYTALQSALINYDNKIWQIPGLFFGVATLLANYIFGKPPEFGVLIISIFGSFALFILILLHNKAHIFHVSIQKKINEFDKYYSKFDKTEIKRIPITSMGAKKLKLRFSELEVNFLNGNEDIGAKFNCVQKWLACLQVSWWVRWIMHVTFLVNIIYVLFLINKIY